MANEKVDFKTEWRRKSNVSDKYPFDVSFCPKESDIVKGTPVHKVSESTYDKIASTLSDFTTKEKKAFGIKEKKEKTGSSCTHKVFIITDGKRHLAIDNQGFCYPRYKGVVCGTEKYSLCKDY